MAHPNDNGDFWSLSRRVLGLAGVNIITFRNMFETLSEGREDRICIREQLIAEAWGLAEHVKFEGEK